MSLAINVDDITDVLIAGTWYPVADASFIIDAYELGQPLAENGPFDKYGGDGDGFAFEHAGRPGEWTYGPLTSIQAVRGRMDRERLAGR